MSSKGADKHLLVGVPGSGRDHGRHLLLPAGGDVGGIDKAAIPGDEGVGRDPQTARVAKRCASRTVEGF